MWGAGPAEAFAKQLCDEPPGVALLTGFDEGHDLHFEMLKTGGAMGVLIQGTQRSTGARLVLKFNKTRMGGMPDSASPVECDATRLFWELLAATGVSAHVIRPFGKLECMPVSASDSYVLGLVIEALDGIETTDGGRVHDLRTFVHAGVAGRIRDFDAQFRAAMFQTLFTLQALAVLTANGIRHNDLHSKNVGVTTWGPDDSARVVEYNVCMDGVVWRYRVASPMRAVLLDHGWTAVLPRVGGPDHDSRFFDVQPTTRSRKGQQPVFGAFETKSGMSSVLPCELYDHALVMSCVLTEIVNHKAPLSPCLQEFKAMYDELYSGLRENKLLRTSGNFAARLTLESQKSGTAAALGPKLNTVLRHAFFAPLRCGVERQPGALQLGATRFGAVHKASLFGFGDASALCAPETTQQWVRTTASDTWKQADGVYSKWFGRLQKAAAERCTGARCMSAADAAKWTSVTIASRKRPRSEPATRPATPPIHSVPRTIRLKRPLTPKHKPVFLFEARRRPATPTL